MVKSLASWVKPDEDDGLRSELYEGWFVRVSTDPEALWREAQKKGRAEAIVRAALRIIQKHSRTKLPGPSLDMARAYRPAYVGPESAMVVSFITNKACKMVLPRNHENLSRYYMLKHYCIWAAMKLGALGGWDKDPEGKPIYVIGLKGFGRLRYHDANHELKARLGEFGERQARIYPIPDHTPNLVQILGLQA